ncbi:MAG TPA: FAD/NAD(P)-binding protein [Ktedonobacteraceae bacterium]
MIYATFPSMIAVIGGGASGTLVAAQLIRHAQHPIHLLLIERQEQMSRGIAYSTTDLHHLLNVPARDMSAYPDQPDHLINWLKRQPDLSEALRTNLPDTFIPRYVFGSYLQSVLEEAQASSTMVELERVHDEVCALSPSANGLLLQLKSGQQRFVHDAVLALGNFPPRDPLVSTPEFYRSSRYRGNPWGPDMLADVDPDSPVLIIGTGLTAADVLVSLEAQGHRGAITAVSRHGLLPQAHLGYRHPSLHVSPEEIPTTARGLVHWMRARVEQAMQEGNDWRSAIDMVRPYTQDIWQRLSFEEKRRFLRHVHTYWDIRRHRVAPAIGATIDRLIASGQLQCYAGRVSRYEEQEDGVMVIVTLRRTEQEVKIHTGLVINCTGPVGNVRTVGHPLLMNLLEVEMIRPDPLGLGLDGTADGVLIDTEGHPAQHLWTLGSLLKGRLWETIAVPDIRGQAEKVALNVLRVHERAFA